MNLKNVIAIVMSSVFLMAGCSGAGESESTEASQKSKTESETQNKTTEKTDEKSSVKPLKVSENQLIDKSGNYPQLEEKVEGEISATLKTNKGDIELRLFSKQAPKAVENFVTHAKEGYYNGLIFHRVIKDFMIQGGDPNGNGTGGESIWKKPFENEMSSSMRSFRGALCMANSGLDTNGSQFYIVQAPNVDSFKTELEELKNNQEKTLTIDFINKSSLLQQYAKTVLAKTEQKIASEKDIEALFSETKVKDVFPTVVIDEYLKNGGYPFLDFGYTVFGQVKTGIEVVDNIASVKTNNDDKPVEDIIINEIIVKE